MNQVTRIMHHLDHYSDVVLDIHTATNIADLTCLRSRLETYADALREAITNGKLKPETGMAYVIEVEQGVGRKIQWLMNHMLN